MAQVYSLNVVGYINVPLVDGFNLVANQLDADGTGMNNTVAGVLSSNVPEGTAVYTWNGTGYNPTASYAKNKSGQLVWNASGTNSLNPGQGCWISVKGLGAGVTQMVTTVGQVLQGGLVNSYIPAAGGFSILSSMVPIQGLLGTDLKYAPAENDKVYTWNPAGQAYNATASYAKNKSGQLVWSPSEPTIHVGEGFWLSTKAGQVWSNYFTVQ